MPTKKQRESKYNPQEIEPKWQQVWDKEQTFSPNLREPFDSAQGKAKPYYNLMMFPYPSAEGLHAGNIYAFTGADVWGRFQRMKGNSVFQPIGLDGFGIHSENYAIKVGRHPVQISQDTEKRYYAQLKATGIGFDWRHILETYDPDYYRWTQWLFIQMFKAGLAYRKKAEVNWCPSCKTVLADEQVITGKCERCTSEVEKRQLEQWFFKITNFADRLLEGLEKIDWTEKVKIAQRNWIGRSVGAEVRFKVKGSSEQITVFTTRPDTLYGATFMVLATDSEWVEKLSTDDQKVLIQKYIQSNKNVQENLDTKEKSGVFTGSYVINPATQEEIPVYISNYVLSGYGSGAVMGVPAHDQRDFEFAKKYNLPIRTVIQPITGEPKKDEEKRKSIVAFVKNSKNGKVLSINWGEKLGGNLLVGGGLEEGEDPIEAAKREIQEETGYQHIKFIDQTEHIEHHYTAHSKQVDREIDAVGLYFELEDDKQIGTKLEENEKGNFTIEWLDIDEADSRIVDPLHRIVFERFAKSKVYAGSGKLINSGKWDGLSVPDVMDRIFEDLEKQGWGERKVTYHLRDWLISRQRYWGPPIPMIFCQSCADSAKGERKDAPGWYSTPEDQLPVKLPFVENFKPTGTGEAPLAQDDNFVNVACPECGGAARRETDVSDTFLDSAWYYLRYLVTDRDDVPFPSAKFDPNLGVISKNWLPVSMYIGGAEHSVLHLMYVRFVTMVLHDLGYLDFEEPFPRFYAHGLLIKEGKKMSKSKGNVIVPDEYIQKYGADTLRTYLMFLAPFNQGGDFRDSGIEGMNRFLGRAWRVVVEKPRAKSQSEAEARLVNKAIKRVTEDLEDLRYNRAIAGTMEYINWLEEQPQISRQAVEVVVQLLAPFAPHMTEELWEMIHKGDKGDKHDSVHLSRWPEFDNSLIQEDIVQIPVQVNGKLRGTVEVEAGREVEQEYVEQKARENTGVAKYLTSEPKKVIFVPGKLINFVIDK